MAKDKEVKSWITVKGRHIPLFEGESKADAIKRVTENKDKQEVKKVLLKTDSKDNGIKFKPDEKEIQIANNRAEADKRNEAEKAYYFKGKKVSKEEFDKLQNEATMQARMEKVKKAYEYSKQKIDKEYYSWNETVLDAQYEHDIPQRDVKTLENMMKVYAMKKGKFEKHHEEWDKKFREQGVNIDSVLNKNKKLEKVHEAKDLLKDYKGYQQDEKLKETEKYLQDNMDKYDANREAWRTRNKELDAARDKYVTKEDIAMLGGRDIARMFVEDEDHPEIMEIKDKADKLYEDIKEYEKVRDEYYETLESLDKKQSRKERLEYGYPDFKKAVGEYAGFKLDDTGTSYYNDLIKNGKAEIVEMTPEQYIKECAYYIFDNSTFEKVLRGRVDSDLEDTEKYAKMMREGTKFYTPYLNYKDEGQEGLHRAVAAYMNGIKKIPVVIVGSRR